MSKVFWNVWHRKGHTHLLASLSWILWNLRYRTSNLRCRTLNPQCWQTYDVVCSMLYVTSYVPCRTSTYYDIEYDVVRLTYDASGILTPWYPTIYRHMTSYDVIWRYMVGYSSIWRVHTHNNTINFSYMGIFFQCLNMPAYTTHANCMSCWIQK